MVHYNSLNIRLLNSQLDKLKSGIKNCTEVTLNFSSNVIGDSYDETYFPHRLLLADSQVSRLSRAFVNNSSTKYRFFSPLLVDMTSSKITREKRSIE